MDTNRPFDEERIAQLLANLPPAPAAWVERAVQIPRVERDLEDVQRRLDEDALLRAAFDERGEQALREAGITLDADVLERLRDQERE
jgi:hypothetical protein